MNTTQELEIVEKYNSGASASKLSTEYGCCHKTVLNIVKRHGGEVRKKGGVLRTLSSEEINVLRDLWRQGGASHTIQRRFKIGHCTLNRWLKQIGETPERRGAKGNSHGNWKGGRCLDRGYVLLWLDPSDSFYEMANSLSYVLEHRYVMAKHLGRPLQKWETVHHIDGDRSNNNIENLQLRIGQHGAGQTFCCADCGSRNVVPIPLDEHPLRRLPRRTSRS